MITLARRTGSSEGGAVAGIEALAFGALVFVVGSLLVANAWAVVDAKMAVSAAAREAVRAFVEAPDATAASGDARRAARATLDAHGRSGPMGYEATATAFERCARVRVTVSVVVPPVALPWVGGFSGAITARASHSELVDPLRSDVPGEARCVR